MLVVLLLARVLGCVFFSNIENHFYRFGRGFQKERKQTKTTSKGRQTAGHQSIAPHGSTAPETQHRGAKHDNKPQHTTGQHATRPSRDTSDKARHQRTTADNHTQQQTPRNNRQQHTAPASANEAAEHHTARNDVDNSTMHDRRHSRTTQHLNPRQSTTTCRDRGPSNSNKPNDQGSSRKGGEAEHDNLTQPTQRSTTQRNRQPDHTAHHDATQHQRKHPNTQQHTTAGLTTKHRTKQYGTAGLSRTPTETPQPAGKSATQHDGTPNSKALAHQHSTAQKYSERHRKLPKTAHTRPQHHTARRGGTQSTRRSRLRGEHQRSTHIPR